MRMDLTGQRVGRLVVEQELEPVPYAYRGRTKRIRRYRCTCDCGNTAVVRQHCLVTQRTQSCGCLHKETIRAVMFKHGRAKTPEYRTWCAMKERCSRPKNISYRNYGAKGIKVCERWQGSFEDFLADMGPKPTLKHTIDRIDPSGDYGPENCRWATHKEQFDNTHNPKFHANIGRAENLPNN